MLHRVKRIRELFIPGVFGLLALIALICVLASCATSSGASPATGVTPGATSGAQQNNRDDGMPTVAVAQLPDEARTTLALIKSGGPFPYHQDGVVFQNRERLLPRESSGYYHEYTVETPGSSDRGARRIIKARDGTLYYTSDHYESFMRIVQ
ncbi:MAG TPA: ribonuclease domain-containing protein [Flexivirga sp.]|uniref:ribonuclease domain-containing protein n=1 Tax=Flexivirga sp. TaxID=1962927 RepID=UPI002D059C70|nr:ribonuclease domain-containing protein [Flexivirga sp.]HWC23412.1 ribonuclease domain-containing protein [Flexivirga sp.]